jgi:chromosome partitioning protein
MDGMITLAIANQKGGVSKTTTTAALGAALASDSRRVLLLDLDPQCSLSQSLGVSAEDKSLAEVLGTSKPGKLSLKQIVCEIRPGLQLAPGDLALSLTESGLMLRMGRENVLKQALASLSGFDLVLIDCPPTLSILTVNALAAAQAVIIPTLPAPNDLRGLQMFLTTLEEIRPINPGLEVLGLIVSQYDQRANSHKQALAALERAGLPILGTVPKTVKVQESQAARQLLPDYDPSGKATEAYQQIAEGIIQWLESNHHKKITT